MLLTDRIQNADRDQGREIAKPFRLKLASAYLLLESGQVDRLNADLYYERPGGKPPFTNAAIDRLIEALDEEFGSEIDRFPEYHKRRSGAPRKTDWYRRVRPVQEWDIT